MDFYNLALIAYASSSLRFSERFLLEPSDNPGDDNLAVYYIVFSPETGKLYLEAGAISDPCCPHRMASDVIRSGILGEFVGENPSLEVHQRKDEPVFEPQPKNDHIPLLNHSEALSIGRAVDEKIAGLVQRLRNTRDHSISIGFLNADVLPLIAEDIKGLISQQSEPQPKGISPQQYSALTSFSSIRMH